MIDKDKILELISRSEEKFAMEIFLKENKNSSIEKDLLLLSGRYEKCIQDYNKGITSIEQHYLSLNQIRESFLSTVLCFYQSEEKNNYNNENPYYIYISGSKVLTLDDYNEEKKGNSIFKSLRRVKDKITKILKDDSDTYIECEMEMKWGLVDFFRCSKNIQLALFYSEKDKLLLSGSGYNIIGNSNIHYNYPERKGSFDWNMSGLPGIIQYLFYSPEAIEKSQKIMNSKFRSSLIDDENYDRRMTEYLIQEYINFFPEQKVYFIARKLSMINGLTIGTPIFVALSDNDNLRKQNLKISYSDIMSNEVRERIEQQEYEKLVLGYNERILLLQKCNDIASFLELMNAQEDFENKSKKYSRFGKTLPVSINFEPFLRDKDVLYYCFQNIEKQPFKIWNLYNAAKRASCDAISEHLLKKYLLTVLKYYPFEVEELNLFNLEQEINTAFDDINKSPYDLHYLYDITQKGRLNDYMFLIVKSLLYSPKNQDRNDALFYIHRDKLHMMSSELPYFLNHKDSFTRQLAVEACVELRLVANIDKINELYLSDNISFVRDAAKAALVKLQNL